MAEKVLKKLLIREKIHGNGTVTLHKANRETLGLRAGDVVYLEIPVDQVKAKERYAARGTI
jgi:bifunctional DNA-binding transcriptional regulator/antitoxin component of YhaV-PrlF toxin-antitoxin module